MAGVDAIGQGAALTSVTPFRGPRPVACGAVVDPSDEHAQRAPEDEVAAEPDPDAGAPALDGPAVETAPPVAPALSRRALRRQRRIARWERPKPPKDWRWFIGSLGKVLIAAGILLFLFVGYQLWGTGIQEAQEQRRLEDRFEDLLADLATSSVPTTTTTTTTLPPGPTTTLPDVPPPVTEPPRPSDTAVPQLLPTIELGDAIGFMEMPTIGVEKFFVAGVRPDDLKKGPGHFPSTPLPGQLGNAGIAGHRTTFGAPFFRVDELEVGDPIITRTPFGTFTYRVTGQVIVTADDGHVLATADPDKAMLTLVSCHPRYTAAQRIIIFADLDPEASDPVGQPLIQYRPLGSVDPDDVEPVDELPGEDTDPTLAPDDTSTPDDTSAPDDTVDGDDPVVTVPGDETVAPDEPVEVPSGELQDELDDAFGRGWFSDPDAWPQVALWGLVLIVIAVIMRLSSRLARRHWVGALIGAVPFTIALYFWFQNVNRLLPPNL